MSAPATEIIPAISAAPARLPLWQRLRAIGTGFGIAIGPRDLRLAIVRGRPAGPALVGETTIPDFRSRPAAEWGAEIARFLSASGESTLAATAMLPRHEVIVRALHLPGVADKDAAAAVELQLDALHPYGDEEVAWGWSRTAADTVLVGVCRKRLTDEYETLFGEAGVPLAALTFSPALIHAARRIWNDAPAEALCSFTGEAGRTEIYGESPARSVYSAEFSAMGERALAAARAELRIAPGTAAGSLADLLPAAAGNPPAGINAYLAALGGSAPLAASFANLLPAERRASHDRIQYAIPAALAALLVAALLVLFLVLPAASDRRYREDLNQAARRLEPIAARARAAERNTSAAKAKIAALDDFRRRSQLDLDTLNELSRILAPPAWSTSVELYPDSVVITGETDNAAPLVKLLDASPLFFNTEFVSSVVKTQQGEQFHIRTMRRGRAGRITP